MSAERGPSSRSYGAVLLGLALGGFFDSILLHQVLQWHHLLSGLDRPGAVDLRFQVMADGLFHAAMYLVALVGLWRLWRRRHRLADGRRILADLLVGFAGWHLIDAVLSHWILGIHRIRMASAFPLLWDLGWLLLFGLVPLLLALQLRRRAPPIGRRAAAAAATAAVLVAAYVAAQPAPGRTSSVVVFRQGVSPEAALAAIAAAGGRPLWSSRDGGIWTVDLTTSPSPLQLYGAGAMLVSGSGALIPPGCLSWT